MAEEPESEKIDDDDDEYYDEDELGGYEQTESDSEVVYEKLDMEPKIEEFNGEADEKTTDFIKEINYKTGLFGAKTTYETKLKNLNLTDEEKEMKKSINGVEVIDVAALIKKLEEDKKKNINEDEKKAIGSKINKLTTMKKTYIPDLIENYKKNLTDESEKKKCIDECIEKINKKAKDSITDYKGFKEAIKCNQEIYIDILKTKEELRKLEEKNGINKESFDSCKDNTVKDKYNVLQTKMEELNKDRISSGDNLLHCVRSGYNFNILLKKRENMVNTFKNVKDRTYVLPIPKAELERSLKVYKEIRENGGLDKEQFEKYEEKKDKQSQTKNSNTRQQKQQQQKEEFWVPLNTPKSNVVSVTPLFRDGTVPKRVAKINFDEKEEKGLIKEEKLTVGERFLNWKKKYFKEHYIKKTAKLERELKVQERKITKNENISKNEKNQILDKIKVLKLKIEKFRVSPTVDKTNIEDKPINQDPPTVDKTKAREYGEGFDDLKNQIYPPQTVATIQDDIETHADTNEKTNEPPVM